MIVLWEIKKYGEVVASNAMRFTPCFVKIGHMVQKLNEA
jgi:hypothetical protein